MYLCLYRGTDARIALVILLQPRVGLRRSGSDFSEPNAVFDLRKRQISTNTEPSRPVHEEIRNGSAAKSPSRTIILKIPLIMIPEMKYCESPSDNTGKLAEKKEQNTKKPNPTILLRVETTLLPGGGLCHEAVSELDHAVDDATKRVSSRFDMTTGRWISGLS
jgi:hypothetical protein